jgi:4-aminobutyrate aminotransferase
MIAVEFASAQTAQTIQQQAMARGLLLLTCGPQGNVIRFLYPLTIPDAQFGQALEILSSVLSQHADS